MTRFLCWLASALIFLMPFALPAPAAAESPVPELAIVTIVDPATEQELTLTREIKAANLVPDGPLFLENDLIRYRWICNSNSTKDGNTCYDKSVPPRKTTPIAAQIAIPYHGDEDPANELLNEQLIFIAQVPQESQIEQSMQQNQPVVIPSQNMAARPFVGYICPGPPKYFQTPPNGCKA